MKKVLRILGVILVAAAVVVLAYNFLPGNDGAVQTISTSLSGSINEIGELATAEYGYTMAQTLDKPPKELIGIKIPFTESKIIYSYDGKIKAGVDFTKVAAKVDEAAGVVYVTMPEAVILSSEVDNDSLVVYDEKNSPFNSLKFEDMNLSIEELKKSAEDNAAKNGLFDSAMENAKKIIRSMVENLNSDKEYKVEFNNANS